MEKNIFKFQKKAETKSRFKRIEGSNILPKTLTISNEDVTPRQDAGIRNILQKVGSFVGEFRKSDVSPYKISPVRPRITGTIFGSKGIFDYSDLGFANEKNQFQRGRDLIVFLNLQNNIFEIWFFKNGWILKDQILQNIARNS